MASCRPMSTLYSAIICNMKEIPRIRCGRSRRRLFATAPHRYQARRCVCEFTVQRLGHESHKPPHEPPVELTTRGRETHQRILGHQATPQRHALRVCLISVRSMIPSPSHPSAWFVTPRRAGRDVWRGRRGRRFLRRAWEEMEGVGRDIKEGKFGYGHGTGAE